jgi:hypothetical protein
MLDAGYWILVSTNLTLDGGYLIFRIQNIEISIMVNVLSHILHPVSSIQHPVSSIQHPVSETL